MLNKLANIKQHVFFNDINLEYMKLFHGLSFIQMFVWEYFLTMYACNFVSKT